MGWTDSSLRYRSTPQLPGSGKTCRCVSAERLASASTRRMASSTQLRAAAELRSSVRDPRRRRLTSRHLPLTAPEDCLLIVIDAQPGFYPADLPRGRSRAGRTGARPRRVAGGARPRAGRARRRTEEEPERNGATDPRIAPGAPVFIKPTFGLAGTPEILQAVRATGRSTAVLVGFETDVCVLQSAVGLMDAGLRVLAVEDAVFSPGEMQARGLDRLRDAGADLTHCKALAYEWVRTVERSTELLSSGVLGPARSGSEPSWSPGHARHRGSGRLRAAGTRLLRPRARGPDHRLHLHRRRKARPRSARPRDRVLLGDRPARRADLPRRRVPPRTPSCT